MCKIRKKRRQKSAKAIQWVSIACLLNTETAVELSTITAAATAGFSGCWPTCLECSDIRDNAISVDVDLQPASGRRGFSESTSAPPYLTHLVTNYTFNIEIAMVRSQLLFYLLTYTNVTSAKERPFRVTMVWIVCRQIKQEPRMLSQAINRAMQQSVRIDNKRRTVSSGISKEQSNSKLRRW